MTWTTRTKPSQANFNWDDVMNFWDENDLFWDTAGWEDRPDIYSSWGDSCFFSCNYYPFLDTGYPFSKTCPTSISSSWTTRT
jgi:hypothetical protein